LIQNAPSNTTTYVSSFPNTNTSNNGIAKIDYRINDKHQINGMLYKATYFAVGEDFPMVNSAWENNFPVYGWTASGNWVWTASSSLVNELRLGYNRSGQCLCLQDTTPADGVGYPLNTGITSLAGFPSVVISGFGQTQLGSRRGRPMESGPSPYYDLQDAISYLRGKHSFKFGGEYSHIEGGNDGHDTRGRINFKGGQVTTGPLAGTSTPLEDFFAGVPTDAPLLVGNPAIAAISHVYGVFAQDDWRVVPKLMLNLGLRWEYRSPFREVNNLFGNFDPNSPTGIVQQGQASVGNTLWKPDYKNWSPRIGFAYDVTGKGTTVVRGGAGIFYSMFSVAPFVGNPGIANTPSTGIATIPTAACNMPVPVGETCSQVPGASTLGGTIPTGTVDLPGTALNWNGVVFPTGASVSCTAKNPCSIGSVDPHLKTPYVYDWSLGVQHAFTSSLSLDVEYVGTRGGNLIGNVDLNQAPAGAGFCLNAPLTAAQLAGACNPANPSKLPTVGSPSSKAVQQARPYNVQFPYLAFINHIENYARSHYNSLQVTVTERPMHGLSFTGGYTYGHGLDNGSLNRFGGQPMDSTNPGREYSSSDFDIRHRGTISASYDIPGKKGFGQMLEGWKLNTIVTIAGPQPWNIVDSKDNFSGTIENTDRWDFFGNPSDFQVTSSSIPFCKGFGSAKGVSCSETSGVSGIKTPLPSSLGAQCTAVAPDPRTLNRAGCYVDGSSVLVPAALGTFGTMARNIFRDTGFKNVDFSIFKNFKFTERFGAQFRVEFFNLFNRPIITNPFGSVNGSQTGSDPSSGGGFGCGCTTPDIAAGNPIVGSGDAREMQLGFKLTF